jgi:hypothetical protein
MESRRGLRMPTVARSDVSICLTIIGDLSTESAILPYTALIRVPTRSRHGRLRSFIRRLAIKICLSSPPRLGYARLRYG